MSYLKLIRDKIQNLAKSLSTIFHIEVTVVDNNLLRIAGTGDFQSRLNENSPDTSLFSKIIENKFSDLDIYEKNDSICLSCKYLAVCREKNNIAYPIRMDNEVIGIASFASFDTLQYDTMNDNKFEYIEILKQFINIIEEEIESVKAINKLNSNIAEFNTIINSIDKGIIIINEKWEVTNINLKAISALGLNTSKSNIIDKQISSIISNIQLKSTENREVRAEWIVFDNIVEVVYVMDHIFLDGHKTSDIINFEIINNIFNPLSQDTMLNHCTFDRIIGNSKEIIDVIEKAKVISKSDSTVVLTGESGTGKELFAKAIHNNSDRSSENFVALNCSAIPENLIESELFGYEKGSFTGADPKGKIGKFQLADNGTIFLDEIGDMPLNVQTKLLRTIQERSIERIGGSKQININIRIIAATNKDLFEMVKNNEFREDLYYRLNVISIYIPPLRSRGNDILLCAEFIISNLVNRMRKDKKILSNEVINIFLKYRWPGNIRELENVLEYALNFSKDTNITINDLPNCFLDNLDKETRDKPIKLDDFRNKFRIGNNNNLEDMKKEFEKHILREYIDLYGDDLNGKSIVAEKLDISLSTLYRKINEH